MVAADEPAAAAGLAKLLQSWNYETVTAIGIHQAIAVSQLPQAPQIALLDWSTPGCTGMEVCRRIRAEALGEQIYLIVVAAPGDKNEILQGLCAGADDYVVRPVDAAELQTRMEIAKRILNLQDRLLFSALASTPADARHAALSTPWNGSAVTNWLAGELVRAERQGSPIGVLLAGVDHFEQIDETYGRSFGDMVLRHVANVLRLSLRVSDTVEFYGEEQLFLIVAPGCRLADLPRFARRLSRSVRARPVELDGLTTEISLSIGGVSMEPGVSGQAEVLISAAEVELCRARAGGPGQVCANAFPPAPCPPLRKADPAVCPFPVTSSASAPANSSGL
jgi:diguanylate cyclase (GGDEF)-like protein